jgi:hypothetical protein
VIDVGNNCDVPDILIAHSTFYTEKRVNNESVKKVAGQGFMPLSSFRAFK